MREGEGRSAEERQSWSVFGPFATRRAALGPSRRRLIARTIKAWSSSSLIDLPVQEGRNKEKGRDRTEGYAKVR